MSTTVDQRVVEMRFDNKHFESNVATTMSTLDKLKHALHLDGASKGLENVNSAANKVNMSGLSSGVEEVRAKFSALEVVGVTALANITNSAVNAGKNLVKSLSVDQITSGWSKYDQKTANVQTLINSTGLGIDEVNGYLEKLMWFSDETSYAFTDMTSGLATMVSSGGDIKKLVPLLMGVANATAFAGKGAAEFSRVLQYGVNQAYSLGYMQVQDWKTIEGATVNSKQLMESLIAAGEAVGTIEKGSINTSNFRSSLKDAWLTKEVMEEGFGYFAEMSEKAYEMVDSGEVETASEAYAKLSEQYDTVSLTAAKAAQEAKTFTEAIDATKDAVSSGWMKSFEIIFGDYAKAKVLWTDLANTLWDVFAAGAEVRNWVLQTALNFAEPWQAIEEKLGNVTKGIEKVKDASKTLEYFQDVVTKVWRGDFNNRGDNPDRYDLLKAAGYDHRVVQDLVNKGYQYKLTVEDVQASHEKFGLTLVTSSEETEELTKKLEALDDETLTNLGLTEEEIELYKALAKEAKRTGKTINQIADNMAKNNGRDLLIDSFKNFGSVILDTIQIIKDALGEIFEIPTAADMVIKLHNIISALHEFSENIRLTEKDTGELSETGKKFLSIFKGIFAAIDIVLTIIKGPAKLAFNVLKELLSFFGVNVIDILAKVGDKMVSFRDTVDNIVNTITKFIVDHVGKWIEAFKETEFFKTTAEWFADASERISGALGSISNKFANFSDSGLGKTLKTIADFISKIIKSVGNSKVVTFAVDTIRGAFDGLKNFFSGFKLPEFSLENLRMFFTNFTNLGNNIKASDKKGLAGVVDGIGKTLSGHKTIVTAKKNFENGIQSFFAGFVNFWLKIGDSLKEAFKICQDALKGIVKFIFGTEEVNLPTIMDAVEKFLWILTLLKTIKLLDSFVAPFENITSALDNVANSLKWKAIASTFKSMALALGVLTVCILVLSSIDDMGKAWQAAGMLAGLLIIMGGVVAGLGFLSSKIGGMDVGGMFGISVSLLILIGAIALMVKTLKDFDDLKLNDPLKTFGYLAATITALSFGVAMVSKAATANFASVAGLLTLIIALKQMLDVITAYDEYDWFGKSKAIEKIMLMMVALSVAINIMSRGVKDNASFKGLAFTLLAMVLSLKILLGVIEDFAAMEDDVLLKGGAVVAALLYMMTAMLAVVNITSKGTVLEKGQKNVNNFTGLAIALLAVCAAIWFLGKLDLATLIQGGIAVSIILGIMTVMLSTLGKSCSGLKTGPIIAMIVGFGLLMAETAALMVWLDDLSEESKISSVTALAGMLLAMSAVLKILSEQNISAKAIWKWIGPLAVLSLIIIELAAVLIAMQDLDALSAISNASALSGLLLAMAGTLKILSKSRVKAKNIYKWIGALAVLGLVVAELAGILYLFKDIDPLSAIGASLGISALLLAMAGTLKIISKSQVKAKNIYKWIGALAVLGLVVGELAFVLYSIKDMNPLTAVGNAVALSTLLVVLAGVAAVLDKFNVGFNGKAVATIALLGAVLFELVGVLDLAEHIDPVAAMPRIEALSRLLVVLAGVALLLDKFNVKFSGGAVGTIALLGAVLFELVGVLDLAEHIDPVAALPRIEALSALLAVLAVVATALDKLNVKFSGGAVGAMSLLALVLGEVAGVLILANLINPEGAMTRVLALSALMGVIAGVLIALDKLNIKFNGGAVAAMSLLALVLGEVAGVLIAANNIKAEGAMTRVLALSALIGVLAVVATALDKFKVKLNIGAVGAMALLGLVLAELAGIMLIANGIDAEGAIVRVTALSILMGVLTLLLIPLSLIGGLAATAFIGIGALAVLMTSLLIVVGVLYLMDGLQNAVANAQALTVMVTVLTLLLIPLTLVGALVPMALMGVGALAVLMASLLIVVGVLWLMEGLEKAQSNVLVLTLLLTALTTTLVTVSLLGPLATNGVTALGALIAMLGTMVTFIIAVGAIMEYCPQIEDFVDNGLGLIIKLAGGVGEMISAFAVGLTSGLPELGQNLTDFANNLKGFLDVMNNNISDSTVEKAGKLAEVVAALVAGDILDSLKGLFGKDDSLASLGTKLSDFGKNISHFVSAINDFDADSATNMDALAGAIESLNKVCGSNNFGDGKLENLGKQTAGFASSMKSVANSLKDLTDDDVANIKRAADGAKEIARLNDYIPKTGGAWQDWAGTSDLKTWGQSIEAFADSLVNYSIKVSGKSFDTEAIKNSAEAAQSLADLTTSLGKVGGLWQGITGQSDLTGFGEAIVPFADSLVAYNNKIVGASIDAEAIKNSAAGAAALVEVVNALPKEGGWFGGERDLEGFGKGLTPLATGLSDYAATAVTIDEAKIEAIKTSGTAVDEIVKVVKKIPKSGGTAGWFGEHDPYEFGNGVTALANGIKKMCDIAATVTQEDIDAITFSQTAVTKIVELTKEIPTEFTADPAKNLKTAVTSVHDVCKAINTISTAGYVYTGIDAVKTAITNITNIITLDAANSLKTKFNSVRQAVNHVADISETLKVLNGNSYGGVAVLKTALSELSEAKVQAVIDTFKGKAAAFQTAVSSIVTALKDGLKSADSKTTVTNAMLELLDSALEALSNETKLAAAETAGQQFASRAAAGTSDEAHAENAYAAGEYLGAGYVKGVNAKQAAAYAAGFLLGQIAAKGINAGQKSNSPSKLGIQSGKWLGEGYSIGIDKMGRSVGQAGSDLGKTATDSLSNSIAKISNMIGNDIDSQPTIRPVLDLSDVESGTAALGSMLDMGSSVGVRANVGAISSMMNLRGQNGVNDDVVTAIDKLSKKMDSMGNTTYHIDGISYDDGTEVASAIQTLVRAARIEGRT